MNTTNIHNLPDYLLRLAGENRRPVPNRYSVTQLIAPPMVRQLTLECWDALSEDVSEMLWVILGRMGHAVIENIASAETLAEEKLEYEYDGATIVQIIDRMHNGVLIDVKFTSVWSFLLGDKPEWEQQLNLYAFGLYRAKGVRPKALRIDAILRDWTKSKVRDPEYPPYPFVTKDIPLWPVEQQEAFLKSRIADLKAADRGEARKCTPEEMWERPTTWAAKKKGAKRAIRVFDTEVSADVYAIAAGLTIEKREGSRQRCKLYCPVRDVCPHNIYSSELYYGDTQEERQPPRRRFNDNGCDACARMPDGRLCPSCENELKDGY